MSQENSPAAPPPDHQAEATERGQTRRFQVSSNRGAARHRVRYTETGGALVDPQECTFCQVTPDLSGTGQGCEVVKAGTAQSRARKND